VAFRFINLRGFRHSARVIRGDYSKREHPGEATPFQALSTAVSGTVGLGSIGGVAVAVTLGGPGATLWMMLAGFLGMSLKFAEVTLAVKYRRVRADGTVTGGAMYYVPEALGRVGLPRLGKFLAGFFCVAAIGGSVTIFQVSQAYSQVKEVTGFDQAFLFGLMVAIWIGIVLFGGVKRIVKWTDKLSPFMCLLYIVACLVVLGVNYANILPALATIVREAFVPDAVAGGAIGALIMGFRRAAFANEAGIGFRAHGARHGAYERAHVAGLRGAHGTLPRHRHHLPAHGAGHRGQRRQRDQLERRHRAHLGCLRHRGAVVPGRARRWWPCCSRCPPCSRGATTASRHGCGCFPRPKASRVAFRLFLCAMLSIAATFPLDQVVNIVDSCSFCMAIPNIIAIYLLMPELRADLASYWQRVVLKNGEGVVNVA
jgi:AGCS family alanine or glycine:cation symporter